MEREDAIPTGDHILIPILNYVTWKKCSNMLCGYDGEKT